MKELFNYFSCSFMNLPAFFFKQAVVDYFLGEGMLEEVFKFRLDTPCFDKIKTLKTAETSVNSFFKLADPFQDLVIKKPPDHRSLLQNPF